LIFFFIPIFLFNAKQGVSQTDSTLIKADTLLTAIDSTNVSDSLSVRVKPPPLAEKLPVLSRADSIKVVYFFATIDSLKVESFHSIDTSIFEFHQFDPLEYGNLFYSTLSNIGLAHKNFTFTPTFYTGYRMDSPTFEKYMTSNSEVKYYQQVIPYTDIHYIAGPKKEHNFYLVFSRELFKGFSIGLDLGIIQSPGEYKNSKSDNSKVFFTGQYYTPNKRYGVIANYLKNKILVEENGGITNDSDFEYNPEKDRSLIPLNLSDDQNLIIQSGFILSNISTY